MPAQEYVLLVGVYRNPRDAVVGLRQISGSGVLADAVVGAGILDRQAGRTVLQQARGGTLAYAIGTGAAAGVVVGVPFGFPLVGAAAGAGVGAIVGRRMRRWEVEEFSALLTDAVPPGSVGLVAVVDEDDVSLLRGALDRALRVTGRVLDEGPLTDLALTLVRGKPEVSEVLRRQRDGRDDR